MDETLEPHVHEKDPYPCCEHSVEEINALAEVKLRNRGLTLSSICIYILLVSHIVFSYYGKILVIPEVVWAIILTPWFGAAGGRVSAILDDVLARGKK